MVLDNSTWLIGNGNSNNLWLDNRMGASLVSILNPPLAIYPSLTAKLASVIVDGRWQIPGPLLENITVASNILKNTLKVTTLPDKCVWLHSPEGTLSSKLVFQFLCPSSAQLGQATIVWWPSIPPSHSFVFWCMMLSKLPIDVNLQIWGCTLVSICVLCYRQNETSSHLFLSCDIVVALWQWLSLKLNRNISLILVASLLKCILSRCRSHVRDVFAFINSYNS